MKAQSNETVCWLTEAHINISGLKQLKLLLEKKGYGSNILAAILL